MASSSSRVPQSSRTLALAAADERSAAVERRRRTRCAAPLPWPITGEERGEALRGLMRRHGLSYVTAAREIGVAVSTLATWTAGGVDLVLQGRPGNISGLLALVRRLEPAWTDTDVWRTFGVPEGLRGTWHLPDEAAAPTPVRVERLSGEIMSTVPLELQVIAGEGSGGLLLYRSGSEWLCATSRMVPPPGWEVQGRIVGMMPLV